MPHNSFEFVEHFRLLLARVDREPPESRNEDDEAISNCCFAEIEWRDVLLDFDAANCAFCTELACIGRKVLPSRQTTRLPVYYKATP